MPVVEVQMDTRDLNRGIIKFIKDIELETRQFLKIEAESVLTDSRSNFVPVDEAVLKTDNRTTSVEMVDGAWVIFIIYGEGPARAYALALHEHPSEHSPRSWTSADVQFSPAGTGPGYLSIPLNIATGSMLGRYKKHLNRAGLT